MSETMTGRERFLAALRRAVPDRVPIWETAINPRVIQELLPGAGYADFVQAMGFDGVLTSTPSSLYSSEVVGEKDGTRLVRTEWGETRAVTAEVVPIPVDHPVKTRQEWARYRVPDAHTPGRLQQLDDLVARFKGQKAIGVHLHDAFSYPTYILGMSELFLIAYEDPGWLHEIVDATVEHNVQMVGSAAAKGADYVLLGDDYGSTKGPLMSPQHFERFFLPGLARVVRAAKQASLYVIKHTDGNVASILPMMIEAGIDAFHPSDPSAGMDIVQTKQQYGDRLCVAGGIDCGDPLCRWPVEALIGEVRRRIRELAPGGGWIIASSNSIHSTVRPEAYAAMLWAARAFGQTDNLDRYTPVPELETRFGLVHS
jgi:uroporphyrinogen decarboxylase